jgi:hypothetical protein
VNGCGKRFGFHHGRLTINLRRQATASEDNTDSSTPVSRTLTSDGIHQLADCLLGRAVSVLSAISGEVRRDMVLASAILRRTASDNLDGLMIARS